MTPHLENRDGELVLTHRLTALTPALSHRKGEGGWPGGNAFSLNEIQFFSGEPEMVSQRFIDRIDLLFGQPRLEALDFQDTVFLIVADQQP